LVHFCCGLFKKLQPGKDWRGYVEAYAHHELMHACETKKALFEAIAQEAAGQFKGILEYVKKRLDAAKVPFSEWNLFEDARIEAVGRKRMGFPMAWLEFEKLEAADSPRGYFFNLIQNEGEDDPSLLTPAVLGERWVSRVRDYFFCRAVKAHRVDDMMRLLQEWVREFPPPPPPPDGFSGRLSDLLAGLGISQETFEALLAEAEAQEDEKGPKAPALGERHSITPEPDYSNDPIIKDDAVREINESLVQKVAQRLSALLAPACRRERSTQPSKRLSARAFMSGRNDFYRRKVLGSGHSRPIRIVYFIDCSGSMSGEGMDGVPAIDGGIAIAMGLNSLAERGMVEGHIVLHKGDHRTKTKCATYALPQPKEFFARIPSDGGYEALEAALKKNAPLLQKADYVFCNTDGHICDDPVDKIWLARKGIRPIGLYCGHTEWAEALSEWFACAVIRNTTLELLEGIVATVDFAQAKRAGSR
jgi:hypothetical protein